MTRISRGALRKLVNMPLGAIGFALVRKDASRPHLMPTWKERMVHAKSLGFSPRVIFDGGAFTGLWSRDAAHLFPGTRIVLIEPNPFVRESLDRNMSHIQPPPRLCSVALGSCSGRTNLNIWHEGTPDAGASTLDHVSGPARKVMEVDVETLDDIAKETSLMPDFVKLDLQGGELAALKGAEQVLKHAEFVMIEFGCLEAYVGRTTPRDLLEVMYCNDYCLYDIVDCHYRPYDGALTGGDFFFVKNSSVLRSYKGWE